MPIWTYTGRWDEIRDFYSKLRPLIPADYTGLAAIRLHRTGAPLTFEVFGSELPEESLPPLLLLELQDGELTRDWERIELDYDTPWAREDDFHAYRDEVMAFYHAEDALELTAEAILQADEPEEQLLRKALIDHAQVLS